MTKRGGRLQALAMIIQSTKLTWLQTSSAGPSIGMCSRSTAAQPVDAVCPGSSRTKRNRNSGSSCRCRPPRAAFISARTRKICSTREAAGEERRQQQRRDTMNSAPRCWRRRPRASVSAGRALLDRACCSGTMKKPLKTASNARSATMRQPRRSARNAPTPSAAPGRRGGGAPARKRSKAKTLMPIEPSGTRPSSSLRSDRRSQSSAPTPMPAQNSARKA